MKSRTALKLGAVLVLLLGTLGFGGCGMRVIVPKKMRISSPKKRSTAPPTKKRVAPPQPLPGYYTGTLGGADLAVNLADDGTAAVEMDDASVDTKYERLGTTKDGNPVVRLRISPRLVLCYERGPSGLVLVGCRRPHSWVRDRAGKRMSVLSYKGPARPKQPAPSLDAAVLYQDTSQDVHDRWVTLEDNFPGSPRCPPGTKMKRQESVVKGVPTMAFTCEGEGGTTGPFVMAASKPTKTGEAGRDSVHRVLWLGHIEDGERNGRWVFRDQDGRKVMDGRYVDGKEHGLWLYWKPGGEFDRQEVFHHGTRIWSEVDPEGQHLPPPAEVSEFSCHDGTSPIKGSEADVHFMGCGEYDWDAYVSDGRWRGRAILWTDKGHLLFHAYEMEDGTSVVARWYDSGQIMSRAIFKDGMLDGPAYQWHRNGLISTERRFKQDRFHGLMRDWDTRGGLKRYGAYHEGEKDGQWGWASMEAKGLVYQEWDKGKLISNVVHGLHGRVRTTSKFTEEGYVAAQMLAPVSPDLYELVVADAVRKKTGKKLRRKDRARRKAAARAACGKLDDVYREAIEAAPRRDAAREVVGAAVEAWCSKHFDPDRLPGTPSRPVKVGCTGVSGDREVGACVEVTVDGCQKAIRSACDLTAP